MKNKITRRTWAHIIAKYQLVIGILFIGCLAGSYYLGSQMPKIYESKAYVYVPGDVKIFEIAGAGVSDISMSGKDSSPHENRKQWYLNILKSESTARRISQVIPDRSVEIIQKNAEIEGLSNGLQFKISVKDRDPEMAARVATAYPIVAESILREMYIYPLEIEAAKKEKTIQAYERRLEDTQTHLWRRLAQMRYAGYVLEA